MPILDNETRKSISERHEIHQRIYGSFKGHYYVAVHCNLCNWTSNGLTLDEAVRANKVHKRIHPEEAQLDATEISPEEEIAFLHDHECNMVYCNCKCGCHEGPFCDILGTLCSVCVVRDMRGDKEHGKIE